MTRRKATIDALCRRRWPRIRTGARMYDRMVARRYRKIERAERRDGTR